jgi:hypothetical protein
VAGGAPTGGAGGAVLGQSAQPGTLPSAGAGDDSGSTVQYAIAVLIIVAMGLTVSGLMMYGRQE